MSALWMRALRGAYRSLVPARAKNTLRMQLLFDERDKPPVALDTFDERVVLVLAPHMDDEVIGCGGALRRHVLSGARVTVAFLTDGAQGSTELHGRAPRNPAERAAASELAERRKRESRAAADVLGVQDLVFLDEPDGALEPRDDLIARLGTLVTDLRPDVVYLPSVLDTHLDHWAANLAFDRCLAALDPAALPPLLRQYEVWTPLHVNALADIGPVLADKLHALRQFESQLPQLDLVALCTGLAQYRSIHLAGGRGHAEAFFASTPAVYRRLLARFAATRRADAAP